MAYKLEQDPLKDTLASIYIEPLLDIFFVQGIAIPSRGTEMSDDPYPTGTVSRSSPLRQSYQHNVISTVAQCIDVWE